MASYLALHVETTYWAGVDDGGRGGSLGDSDHGGSMRCGGSGRGKRWWSERLLREVGGRGGGRR